MKTDRVTDFNIFGFIHWLNYWHTLVGKYTSGYTSVTFFIDGVLNHVISLMMCRYLTTNELI